MTDSTTSPETLAPAIASTTQSKQPPETGIADLIRLVARLLGAVARRRSAAEAFGSWLHALSVRYASPAIILKLGPKRILVVTGTDVARDILEQQPDERGFVAGKLKADAMSYLAPRALTIAHGHDWSALRHYNEQVLATGRPHDLQHVFLDAVRSSFAHPVYNIDGVRSCMATAMRRIVVGERAPERLAADVQQLIQLVQSPLRRRFAGKRGTHVRARFYHDLREVWYEPEPAARDTLLGVAHAYTGVLDEDEILHQVPHWMFTFTGSGTDLLTRALAIISSRPAVRARVEHEFAAAGSLDDPVCITRLHYLEACLREAGRLFPPVTRTFHRAPAGAVAGGYRIANDVEVLHYLPLFYRYADGSADTHQFRPERWLERDRARRPYPDIFLSGSRACPGQDLILFVCKAAAATLLDRGVVSHSSILSNDPMPLTFPGKEARFAYGSDHP